MLVALMAESDMELSEDVIATILDKVFDRIQAQPFFLLIC